MVVLKIINRDNVSEEEASTYRKRRASRGVVFDENDLVAVLHVSNYNYYKLPGGGIEEGEERGEAFRRECIEEIGREVEIVKELGEIIEYRSQFPVHQTSSCFIGKTVGEAKATAFTEHEISQGFKEPLWVSLEEAYKLVSESIPTDYEGGFIKERDTFILAKALDTSK
jgi:8-oxo-dGTP pyrophosphatase MutT (NUDIX family)